MKKQLFGFIALLTLAAVLGGCAPKPAESGKLQVVASFYPIYDFAAKVGDDKIDLVNVLPVGAEAHHWEPSPRDVAKIQDADVFLYNGVGMEHWVEDILAAIDKQNLLVVETAADADLISGSGHSHDHDDHDHGAFDPHTWLAPQNAKKQMESIQKALAEADPANADYYWENFQRAALELDALDDEYKQALAEISRRDVVVSHRAFGYLCHAYNLHQTGIEGISHDSEPSPEQMQTTIRFIRENNVTTIFYQADDNASVAKTIASETNIATAELHTLESLSQARQDAGDDYFSVMRENLAALVQALQ